MCKNALFWICTGRKKDAKLRHTQKVKGKISFFCIPISSWKISSENREKGKHTQSLSFLTIFSFLLSRFTIIQPEASFFKLASFLLPDVSFFLLPPFLPLNWIFLFLDPSANEKNLKFDIWKIINSYLFLVRTICHTFAPVLWMSQPINSDEIVNQTIFQTEEKGKGKKRDAFLSSSFD